MSLMQNKKIKRVKFASELMTNPDCTIAEAAIVAGYAPSGAAANGSRLLAEPETQALIVAHMNQYEITNERILHELALRAFSNIDDLMTVNEDGVPTYDLTRATREQKAAIAEVTVDETGGDGDGERRRVRRVRIKLQDSLRALEHLARIRRMLKDTVEVDVAINIADRLSRARARIIDAADAADALDAAPAEPIKTAEAASRQDSTSLPPLGGVAPGIQFMENMENGKIEDVNQVVTSPGLGLLGSIMGDDEQNEQQD